MKRIKTKPYLSGTCLHTEALLSVLLKNGGLYEEA